MSPANTSVVISSKFVEHRCPWWWTTPLLRKQPLAGTMEDKNAPVTVDLCDINGVM